MSDEEAVEAPERATEAVVAEEPAREVGTEGEVGTAAEVPADVETAVPADDAGEGDGNEGDGKTGDDDGDESESEDAGIKRRRRKRAMTLDEEDYELLEDNQVTGFKRKEKKKRLQTAAEREGGSVKTPGTIADLERGLFGDDDGDEGEGAGEGAEAAAEALKESAPAPAAKQPVGYSDSEDEMDDFIVRDETDGPRETREERQRRYASAIPGLRRDQLQDAADIFGDTDELHRMFAARKRTDGSQSAPVHAELSDESEDEDEMDDFIEREGATQEDLDQAKAASEARKVAKAQRAEERHRRRSLQSSQASEWASQTFEPSVIKEQMLFRNVSNSNRDPRTRRWIGASRRRGSTIESWAETRFSKSRPRKGTCCCTDGPITNTKTITRNARLTFKV